jgi:hypothetical protein
VGGVPEVSIVRDDQELAMSSFIVMFSSIASCKHQKHCQVNFVLKSDARGKKLSRQLKTSSRAIQLKDNES